jgi:hypothetical protein
VAGGRRRGQEHGACDERTPLADVDVGLRTQPSTLALSAREQAVDSPQGPKARDHFAALRGPEGPLFHGTSFGLAGARGGLLEQFRLALPLKELSSSAAKAVIRSYVLRRG